MNHTLGVARHLTVADVVVVVVCGTIVTLCERGVCILFVSTEFDE